MAMRLSHAPLLHSSPCLTEPDSAWIDSALISSYLAENKMKSFTRYSVSFLILTQHPSGWLTGVQMCAGAGGACSRICQHLITPLSHGARSQQPGGDCPCCNRDCLSIASHAVAMCYFNLKVSHMLFYFQILQRCPADVCYTLDWLQWLLLSAISALYMRGQCVLQHANHDAVRY